MTPAPGPSVLPSFLHPRSQEPFCFTNNHCPPEVILQLFPIKALEVGEAQCAASPRGLLELSRETLVTGPTTKSTKHQPGVAISGGTASLSLSLSEFARPRVIRFQETQVH